MTSLCVPNFDSAPSSMPKLQPINHFPQVNPLVPGVKLLEYFKTLMKFYYRSVFAESFKTFIFQKFRRPLCHKVNLPRFETRRRRFIMTCDIFGTGQTNILGLLLIRKNLQTAHSSSTQVTEINTLDQTTALIETDHTISLAFKAFS